MLYNQPGMTSIPELNFGDRIGGTEAGIFSWRLGSGRTREGKLWRSYRDELEPLAVSLIYRGVSPVAVDIFTQKIR
jgi:hypothetical protein